MGMCSRIAAAAGVSAIALLAAGCTPVDYGMGEAIKYDMAVQTVNPEPVYAPGAAQPGGAGERGALAAERYRRGTVKEPVTMSTGGAG